MSFATDTAFERDGDHFRSQIHDGWDIGGNANGGYLMAIAARAMAAATRPHPVALNAHFLAPGRPGPVICNTQVVKEGKRFATVRGSLMTETKPLVELLGSFADLAAVDGPMRVDATPPELPGPDDCVRLGPETGSPPFMGHFDMRLHPEDAGFMQGKPSGKPMFRGWLKLADDEPVDAFGLILAADAFPPTIFNANMPIAWAPTVEMTAHVRGSAEPGWLRCRFSTRFITGGMLEEDGEIWDESGRLVAQSRQLALVPKEA